MVDTLADGEREVVPFAVGLLPMWRDGIVNHRLNACPRKVFAQMVALGSSYGIDVPDVLSCFGRHLWQRDKWVPDAFAISQRNLPASLVIGI